MAFIILDALADCRPILALANGFELWTISIAMALVLEEEFLNLMLAFGMLAWAPMAFVILEAVSDQWTDAMFAKIFVFNTVSKAVAWLLEILLHLILAL